MLKPLIVLVNFMFKIISLLLVLIMMPVVYFYVPSFIGNNTDKNTHTSAVKKFWYEQKKLLVEGKKTELPVLVDIKTLDYYIGDSTFERGTYYFKTILVINKQEIRIETSVKPSDGIWGVDIKETFMGSHMSTLDHHITAYIKAQEILNTNLGKDYIWGMGESYTVENEANLKKMVSSRLKQLENKIIQLYQVSSQ
jgi:hypothetical protein